MNHEAAWLAGDPCKRPMSVSPVLGTFFHAWRDCSNGFDEKELMQLAVGTHPEHEGDCEYDCHENFDLDDLRREMCASWLYTACAPAFMELMPELHHYARKLQEAKDWFVMVPAMRRVRDLVRRQERGYHPEAGRTGAYAAFAAYHFDDECVDSPGVYLAYDICYDIALQRDVPKDVIDSVRNSARDLIRRACVMNQEDCERVKQWMAQRPPRLMYVFGGRSDE